jgi:hypothetical protein
MLTTAFTGAAVFGAIAGWGRCVQPWPGTGKSPLLRPSQGTIACILRENNLVAKCWKSIRKRTTSMLGRSVRRPKTIHSIWSVLLRAATFFEKVATYQRWWNFARPNYAKGGKTPAQILEESGVNPGGCFCPLPISMLHLENTRPFNFYWSPSLLFEMWHIGCERVIKRVRLSRSLGGIKTRVF